MFAGANGIDIPGAGIKVVLRGVSRSGQGGGHGIYVSGSNELAIERCDIGGMKSNGIFLDGVSGTVQIRDTVVHDNAANGVMSRMAEGPAHEMTLGHNEREHKERCCQRAVGASLAPRASDQ